MQYWKQKSWKGLFSVNAGSHLSEPSTGFFLRRLAQYADKQEGFPFFETATGKTDLRN